MFDYEIVLDSLQKVKKSIETITERISDVNDLSELLCSPIGELRFDAICMNLITIGESIKCIDKQTHS